MKNYDEMANDVLNRIRENEVIKKQKRKLYSNISIIHQVYIPGGNTL